MRGRIVKINKLSKKFHNIFQFTRRTAEITLGDGSRHTFVRHVLETGPAVSVLPYFFDKKERAWYVVLVRQYRPAVDSLSLEAPGGLLQKGVDVKVEMSRELFEESGIEVAPSRIKVIDVHHLANSFCDQIVHLGMVDLKISDRKEFLKKLNVHNGVKSEKEFTEVVVLSLEKLLKSRKQILYTLAKFQILDLAKRLEMLR